MTAIPPLGVLDADGHGVGGQGYDPVSHSFTSRQSGPAITDPTTGIPYAPTVLGGNSGLPLNTPAIVQKAAAASTGSVASLAKAFTGANVAGNSIVVVAGCGNGTAMTVADSNGNVYTQAVTAPNSTTFEAAIFFSVGPATGGGIVAGANTVTVTNAGTAASMAVEIYEVSGLLAQMVAQPDQSTSATGTSATATASALAASSPNSLAFMGVAVGTAAQAVSVTAGSGWTLDSTQNTTTPAGLFTFGALSQALPGTTPVVPKATIASSEPFAVAAAVFKPVVLGVQGTVTIGGYNYTRVTGTGTTLVKTGPGILHAVIVNKPTATATIELDDALTNTTPIIALLAAFAASIAPFSLIYDVAFVTGLSVTVGVAAVDATIVWK
jgi:hypothetical protein